MAVKTRTITTRTDDLGGAGEAHSNTLTLNGRTVKIDLNKRNAETLARHLEKYFSAGEEVTPDHYPQGSVRKWALEHGYEVKPQGRVPLEVEFAFLQAQQA